MNKWFHYPSTREPSHLRANRLVYAKRRNKTALPAPPQMFSNDFKRVPEAAAYLRRAELPLMNRGDVFCDVEIPRRRVAATPRPQHGDSVEISRADAAAATWIFRGESSRRRGYFVATGARLRYLARVGERGAHGKTVEQVRANAVAGIRQAICDGANVTLGVWCVNYTGVGD